MITQSSAWPLVLRLLRYGPRVLAGGGAALYGCGRERDCKACGATKELHEFAVDSWRKDGTARHKPVCKACINAAAVTKTQERKTA